MQDLPPSQALHRFFHNALQAVAAVEIGNCLPGTLCAALAPGALAGRAETASGNVKAVIRRSSKSFSFAYLLYILSEACTAVWLHTVKVVAIRRAGDNPVTVQSWKSDVPR